MGIDLIKLVDAEANWVNRKVFTDQEVYQLELEHIFAKNWLYLCHESQIPNPGDFVTAYMGETPVIVARGEDKKIHVSVNSCSHRGLPVCRQDSGNAKRFVCPYHSWAYSVEGDLKGLPQSRKVCQQPDMSTLGLKKIPRVETYRELVFGCFAKDIESLETYLGDMRFYLDTYFNRFPGGIEVIGEPHKWMIEANWKLPVENQLSDVTHGPALHNSLLPADSEPVDEINQFGLNCVARPGHGACVRLMPKDYDPAKIAWGMEGFAIASGSAELMEYLLDMQQQAHKQLGDTGARIKGLTYGVYPNMSFLYSNSTLRVSHPRGPGKVEYWSWWVVPRQAPESIKKLLRTNYTLLFGPGGMLEQEDSEAWSQQYAGSNIPNMEDTPYYYGLGLGEEGPHDELPGIVGSSYNEHTMRAFYQRWREEIDRGIS